MPRPLHLFLPVYRDVPSFRRLRGEIEGALPGGFTARFHVIDDSAGEDPETRDLPGVEVLTPPRPLGHQGALAYGIRLTLPSLPRDAIVATMDADGEDRPEDLPRLLAEFLAHESERPVVLARRTSREEGPLFKAMYFFYRQAFRVLTGTVIRSGNFAVLHPLALAALVRRRSFAVAYASALVAFGQPRYVPCPRARRYEGRSRMGFRRLAAHGVRMLLPFADRVAVRAAKALVALLVVSSLATASLAVSRGAPEWAGLASLASLVAALLTFLQLSLLRAVVGRIGAGQG